MARAHAISESGHWDADPHPIEIEYALSVMERIRADAVEGFCRFPRGGIEIGGILFGNAEGTLVRILASRAVDSEYAFGPSYVLSEKDEALFRRVLEAARTDPELTGLIPVGWYHSHTRSEIFLSPQDLAIQDRYFPGRRQIALVVKPEPFGSARAGFFVREPDGSIRAEASYREFVVSLPARQRSRAPAEPPEPAAAVPEPVATPLESPEPAATGPVDGDRDAAQAPFPPEPRTGAPEPAAFVPEPFWDEDVAAPRRLPHWMWFATAVLLAICAGILITHLRRPIAPPARPLALRVLDVDGQLQIAWDRGAIRGGPNERASLDISEGTEHVRVPFDAQILRDGAVTYARRSENVEVRLRVERPEGAQEEFVQFLGNPATEPRASAPAALSAIPEPPPPVEAGKTPAPATDRTNETRTPAAEPVQARPPAAVKPAPRNFNLAQLPARKASSREVALPAPPVVEASAAHVAQTGVLPPLPSAIRSEPPPPAAPAPTAPAIPVAPAATPRPKPIYTGPSSGRIIWTGDLTRGATLSLDGHRASAGTLTGELPGLPVRISVHPADLSGRGLTVFTASGRASREPAGPQNGWNPTSYTVDPRRAGELLVLESPGPQNGWKKLAFRDDNRDIAVVVIDWKLAQ